MKISVVFSAIITSSFTFLTATGSGLRSNSNIPDKTQANLEAIAQDLQKDHEHGRDLQAGFICDRIENAFNGAVTCDCSIRYTTLKVSFNCAYEQPACTPQTVAGTFCSQPKYAGKLSLRPLRASATLENNVCAGNVTLTDSPAGNVFFENLCVDTDLCFRLGQGLQICQCSATYGGSSCQCTPCNLGNGGTGVMLDCVDVGTPVCIPLSFPLSASEANSVQPFIPMLAMPQN